MKIRKDISKEVLEIVQKAISKDEDRINGFNCYPLTEEDTFNSIGMDSLDFVSLIFDIEEHFLISIPDEEFEEIGLDNPLSKLVDYVYLHQNQ